MTQATENAPNAPGDTVREASLTRRSLDAQTALMPQALLIFGVSLPIFVWAGSYAANAAFMAASFAVFAINWGAFYAAVTWLNTPAAEDLRRRHRVQLLCGLLWAVAAGQVAAFADGAGPARDSLLLMASGAAVLCIFFAASDLASLLVIAPAAIAGPLICAFSRQSEWWLGGVMWGAFALAFLLGLILNGNLRRQFELAADADRLAAELEESLARAERIARSKSALVETLSQEIRNGLTGVAHVLAAAAGQGHRGAPSRDQLNAALGAANDLIAVLNATLDSETAEAGRLAVDAEPFDPAPIVLDLAATFRPQAAAKGLEFSVFIDPDLAEHPGAAVADADRVRQVLQALVANAVKYTVRGRIEARLERSSAHRLRIAIADTGPGLSADELEQAFEPFRRIERTGAGVPGAGLGLSLSRQLVRLMDAELTAESAPGVGSCFALELPFDETARPAATNGGMPEGAIPARSLRVLLAEDDALSAAQLRATFEQLGHQVVHASNGRRALDLAQAAEFDLVILDAFMPEMSGADVARALRDAPPPSGPVRMVGLTGGDPEEAIGLQETGVTVLLRKPVSVAAVARAVADASAPVRKARRGRAA